MDGNVDCGSIGRCDFCHFSNLKVKPLTCMRHFYCLTCRKYVDRLQRQDFSCKLCKRNQRQTQIDRRRQSRILDNFIEETASERRARQFQVAPFTMSGSRVISLDTDDDNNDQDTSVKNEDWEQLISSLSYKPSCADSEGHAGRSRRSFGMKQSSEAFPKKVAGHCKIGMGKRGGIETTIPSGDAYSPGSRIYDWCLAAEKSLPSGTKPDAYQDHSPLQSACLSSSSENSMGRKKYLQQRKKKDRSYWWDEESESDAENWDVCFSKTINQIKLRQEEGNWEGRISQPPSQISGNKDKCHSEDYFQNPGKLRTSTPEVVQSGLGTTLCMNAKEESHNVQGMYKFASPPVKIPHLTTTAYVSDEGENKVSQAETDDDAWTNDHLSRSPVDTDDSFWDQ